MHIKYVYYSIKNVYKITDEILIQQPQKLLNSIVLAFVNLLQSLLK